MNRIGDLEKLEAYLEPIEEDAGFCSICGIRYPDHIASCPQSPLPYVSKADLRKTLQSVVNAYSNWTLGRISASMYGRVMDPVVLLIRDWLNRT